MSFVLKDFTKLSLDCIKVRVSIQSDLDSLFSSINGESFDKFLDRIHNLIEKKAILGVDRPFRNWHTPYILLNSYSTSKHRKSHHLYSIFLALRSTAEFFAIIAFKQI